MVTKVTGPLIPQTVLQKLRLIQARVRLARAEHAVAGFTRQTGRPHGLGGELVVSLTSYSARFGVLSKTIKSLLSQSIRPDRTVLWIAHNDFAEIPTAVLNLEHHGLEIRVCEDIRSYKKIVPSLRQWPRAYIVTADDDFYYEPKWLEKIVGGVVPDQKVIVCRRAHRPILAGLSFAPYANWDWDVVTDEDVRDDLFPTGGAGALYPPGSLAPEVLDQELFTRICPTADDVWLYFMGRRAGSRYRQVGGGFAQVSWPGAEAASLLQTNLAGANDVQIKSVKEYFGA